MTTPSVQYVYADGSNNTIRPTAVVYPNGRTLHASYGSPGGMDDAASRVAALIDDDGTTHLADYSYLGLGSPVVVDYTQPQIKFTLVGTAGGNDPNTGDIYHGLDRFGRIKDAYWRNHGNNTDSARIQYGYDRASNRTHRHDPVAAAATAQFDELYQYDAIHRLKEMQRGTLNGPKTGLTAESFAQCWSLDPTGNWKGFRQDDTGSGTWDLVQARTANPVNEITGISETAGPSWTTPAYDAAGNMTTVPQPVDPTTSYAATYDAWNRLVKLMNGSDLVQENQYDARNFRIVRKDYVAGVLSETRHFYYTSGWQCLEERLGSSPASAPADRQHIWGLRYIDDLILQDRFNSGFASSSSSSASSTSGERRYALQDDNWNVIALVNDSGAIQERFAFEAYGAPLFLDASFIPQSSSASNWDTLYAGYRQDEATGLYHVRHRVLNFILGIWLQRDPINNGAENPYANVGDNPIGFTDPKGLQMRNCTEKECNFCLDYALNGDRKLFKGDSIVLGIINGVLKGPNGKWLKGCEPNIVCEKCANNNDLGTFDPETKRTSLCVGNLKFEPIPPRDKNGKLIRGNCTAIFETLRHELSHLAVHCTKHKFLRQGESKCEKCICDEYLSYWISGQCEPHSAWIAMTDPKGSNYRGNKGLCLRLSAINSCENQCVVIGKTPGERNQLAIRTLRSCRFPGWGPR